MTSGLTHTNIRQLNSDMVADAQEPGRATRLPWSIYISHWSLLPPWKNIKNYILQQCWYKNDYNPSEIIFNFFLPILKQFSYSDIIMNFFSFGNEFTQIRNKYEESRRCRRGQGEEVKWTQRHGLSSFTERDQEAERNKRPLCPWSRCKNYNSNNPLLKLEDSPWIVKFEQNHIDYRFLN